MPRKSALGGLIADFLDNVRRTYPETREPIRRIIADVIDRERKYWKQLSVADLESLETLHARFEGSTLGPAFSSMLDTRHGTGTNRKTSVRSPRSSYPRQRF